MKKILSITLVLIMGFIVFIPTTQIKAYNENNSTQISYSKVQIGKDLYEETIINENTLARSSKTGTKTVNYRNSAGSIVWSVSVQGTFYYNGAMASCTASTVLTTCPSSNWKIISRYANKSGNTAIASASASRYTNGVAVQTLTREVRLSCSASGSLS